MEQSILISTKKILMIDSSYDVFDLDLITHINTVFSTLDSLGVGPEGGFMIEDDQANWEDYIGEDLRLNSVKTYMFLRVRLLFDPPATSYLISSLHEQLKEIEWRLNTYREESKWEQPISPTPILP